MVKKLLIIMLVLGFLFLAFKGFEDFYGKLETVYWYIFSMGASPQNSEIFHNKLSELSNDELIRKLKPGHKNNPYPYAAINILAQRQATEAIPGILSLIEHPNYRETVIRAVVKFDDQRVIDALLKIVNDEAVKKEYVWYLSLKSLAKLGYRDIYPIITSLDNNDREELARKVSLLGYFLEYPETIKVLEMVSNGKYPGSLRERAEELLSEYYQSLNNNPVKE
ncbi:MAG: HEAT repeat domain-containing protein [Candidatus Omnitrophica bacterium]|nr:HEAT repeat domain-containing protein [Candidatus Omnitrophota bacterium]